MYSNHLYDLMDRALLAQMQDDGYVRIRVHPEDADLLILNYTEKAQYEKVWNSATLNCRGLIVRRDKIIARPYEKFFNVGEHGPEGLPLNEPVQVTDKLDGSLGIMYLAPDGLHSIATRGSFESEQAKHATELLRREYLWDWKPLSGYTYMFEIVYPENRIVLDYDGLDDLVLLGARNLNTGVLYGPRFDQTWIGPRAQTFGVRTLREALELPPRDNAEGLVVRYTAPPGRQVKIKQEDYVRLHKLVTGLNEKAVWEHLQANEGRIDQMVMVIPDEFHKWVREVADRFIGDFEIFQGRAHEAYHHLVEHLDDHFGEGSWERKHFAFLVREQHPDLAPLLFQMLDGRDISASIWKSLKPRGETTSLLNRTEDNA